MVRLSQTLLVVPSGFFQSDNFDYVGAASVASSHRKLIIKGVLKVGLLEHGIIQPKLWGSLGTVWGFEQKKNELRC